MIEQLIANRPQDPLHFPSPDPFAPGLPGVGLPNPINSPGLPGLPTYPASPWKGTPTAEPYRKSIVEEVEEDAIRRAKEREERRKFQEALDLVNKYRERNPNPNSEPVERKVPLEERLPEKKPAAVEVDPDSAQGFISEALSILEARAKMRDTNGGKGERSMEKIVKIFNTLYGKDLTVEQGWMFMVLLKLVRSANGFYDRDSYADGLNYVALAGESASQDREKKPE